MNRLKFPKIDKLRFLKISKSAFSRLEKPSFTTPSTEELQNIKLKPGGRNLVLLGIFALVIAFFTTAVSLFIYRKTGAIYLDRSRPGYVSEKDKYSAPPQNVSSFSGDGPLDQENVDLYLERLDATRKNIKAFDKAFSASPLSDESLGLSENTTPPAANESEK